MILCLFRSIFIIVKYIYILIDMFSYKINNPNNFCIDVKGDYYAIPFGHRCTSALACKFAHMRKF